MNENPMPSDNQTERELASRIAFFCIAAIFVVPAFGTVFLASWDGSFFDWQQAARIFFLPALYLEIAICIVAVAKGMKLLVLFAKLPITVRICLILWLLSLFVSTISADANKSAAILGASFWLVHVLFFLSVLFLVTAAGLEALRLERLAIISPTSAAVAGLIIYAFANAKGLDGNVEWVSYLPGFANIRHTGYIFAPAIAISLASIAARPSQFVRTHMLLLIVNSALMLWLGSRGPVFGILVAMVFCMACFSEMRSIRFLSKATFAGTFGALLSILAPLPQHSAFGALQRFWSTSSGPATLSSGRVDFWAETVDLILQRPFIGHGVFQFQFVSVNASGIYKHPHDSILQFMFDWGLLGGGLFLSLMGMAIYAAFFRAKCSPYVKLLSAMGFTTMLAYSLIDGLFFYSQPIAVSMIFLIIPIATGFPWAAKSSQF